MALIHLEAKLDGFNVETALVKAPGNPDGYRLIMLDFDRTRDLTPLFASGERDKILKAILKTSLLEFYYPFPTSRGFRCFREGYLKTAAELDRKRGGSFLLELAKEFFSRYIAIWLKKRFPRMQAIETRGEENHLWRKLLNRKKILSEIIELVERNDYYIDDETIVNKLKAKSGRVILLFGPPCSGKTTIAQKLMEKLSENFQIIKRKRIGMMILKDYIKSATGENAVNDRQTLSIAKKLSKKYRFDLKNYCKKLAVAPTIKYIKRRSLRGENSIFDICLYDSDLLAKMREINAAQVLVYCPLGELLRRKNIRNRLKGDLSLSNRSVTDGYFTLFSDMTWPEICSKYYFALPVNSAGSDPEEIADIIIARFFTDFN